MSSEFQRRIVEAANAAHVDFGSSNLQLFLNTLPNDDLSEDSNSSCSAESLNSVVVLNNMTPNRNVTKIGKTAADPPTPTLSLPDSFDGYYSNTNGLQYEQFFSTCKRCNILREHNIQVVASNEMKHKSVISNITAEYETELKRLKKVCILTEENHLLEVTKLNERIERLSTLIDTETTLRRLNEDRAAKYDKIAVEHKQSLQALEDMRLTVEQQRVAFTTLSENEQTSRKMAEEATKLRDLLALDKSFLQQEVRSLETKLDERMRLLESSNTKNASLDLRVTQLTDQLLNSQLTARSGFDDRLDKEVTRLRDDASREMDAMKATSREILDRENRVLKDAKECLDIECAQLRRRNDSLTAEISALRQELSAFSTDKNNEVATVRAELKVKAFELTALGVNYEERMAHIRQMELQMSNMQQELTIHKQALARMESENGHQVSTLQSELERLSGRLRAYEVLEEEVDQAVMRTADSNVSSDDGDDSQCKHRAASNVLQQIKGIPCNPERRVRQAVYLAQRLMETERQRDQISAKLSATEAELSSALNSLECAKEDVMHTTKPTSYLVSKLRDEERQKLSLQSRCKELEANLKRRKQLQSAAVIEATQLRERLFNLLEHRGELETVKGMVRQLCEMTAACTTTADDFPLRLLRSAHTADDISGSSTSGSSSSDESSSDDTADNGCEGKADAEDYANQNYPAVTTATQSIRVNVQKKDITHDATLSSPQKLEAAHPLSAAQFFGLSPEMVAKITSPPSRRSGGFVTVTQ